MWKFASNEVRVANTQKKIVNDECSFLSEEEEQKAIAEFQAKAKKDFEEKKIRSQKREEKKKKKKYKKAKTIRKLRKNLQKKRMKERKKRQRKYQKERHEKEVKRLIFESSMQDRATAALIHEQKEQLEDACDIDDSFGWSDTDEEDENDDLKWWETPLEGNDDVTNAQREIEKRIFGNLI